MKPGAWRSQAAGNGERDSWRHLDIQPEKKKKKKTREFENWIVAGAGSAGPHWRESGAAGPASDQETREQQAQLET